ncbi:MAG: hypothetical protein GY809_10790 [Planctomycetes bacterium]|nr:hypothetical protein [Planctomycetota bacterium]
MMPSTRTHHVTVRTVHGAVRMYCLMFAVAVIGLFCSSCEALMPAVSGSESDRPFFEEIDLDPAIPNPETVIGHGIADKKAEMPKKDKGKGDIETLKRTDQWQRTFSPGGVFLAGHGDVSAYPLVRRCQRSL